MGAVAVGSPHHVTQRGAGRQTVFFTDRDRAVYLNAFSDYATRYGRGRAARTDVSMFLRPSDEWNRLVPSRSGLSPLIPWNDARIWRHCHQTLVRSRR